MGSELKDETLGEVEPNVCCCRIWHSGHHSLNWHCWEFVFERQIECALKYIKSVYLPVPSSVCSKEVCWFWWTHSPLHLKNIWRAGRARQCSLMGLLLTMYASSGSCRKWGSVPDIAERPSRDPATHIQELGVSANRKVPVSFNAKQERLTKQIHSDDSYLSASSYNQTHQPGLPDSKLTHFLNRPVNHFQKRSQVGWRFQTSTIWAGDTER